MSVKKVISIVLTLLVVFSLTAQIYAEEQFGTSGLNDISKDEIAYLGGVKNK